MGWRRMSDERNDHVAEEDEADDEEDESEEQGEYGEDELDGQSEEDEEDDGSGCDAAGLWSPNATRAMPFTVGSSSRVAVG